jgi:hypothetical protein
MNPLSQVHSKLSEALSEAPTIDQRETPRRELKYLLPYSAGRCPELFVKALIPSLKVEYPPRLISSVYFDTASYASYEQSNSGMSERMKLRLRWYDNLRIAERPTLEFKHRVNAQGWKRQYKLMPMQLEGVGWDVIRTSIAAQVLDRNSLHIAAFRFPILIASYYRHYFITVNRKIRLTVDTELHFLDQRYRPRPNFTFDAVHGDFAVVECKMDKTLDASAAGLVKPLGLRWTRFSKYCFGLAALSRL